MCVSVCIRNGCWFLILQTTLKLNSTEPSPTEEMRTVSIRASIRSGTYTKNNECVSHRNGEKDGYLTAVVVHILIFWAIFYLLTPECASVVGCYDYATNNSRCSFLVMRSFASALKQKTENWKLHKRIALKLAKFILFVVNLKQISS